MRKRWPAALCVMHAGLTNVAELLNPASKRLMSMAEHELVDMGEVALEMDKKKPLPKVNGKRRRHYPCKGVCMLAGCTIKKPKRSQLRCGSCKDGAGGYYHLGCFFKAHRCVKV